MNEQKNCTLSKVPLTGLYSLKKMRQQLKWLQCQETMDAQLVSISVVVETNFSIPMFEGVQGIVTQQMDFELNRNLFP
jgi:hypothetical protein